MSIVHGVNVTEFLIPYAWVQFAHKILKKACKI